MAETSTAVALITSVIQGLSLSTTALKPPPPDFKAEPLKVYLDDLKLTAAELETVPADVQDNWQQHIFHTRRSLGRMISPSSIAGQAIAYAEPHIRSFEDQTKQRAFETYEGIADDADRASLYQVWRFSTWAWRGIGSYITHNLMEGAFLGYNDQMRFDLATRFSYQRMMHHATKADAYRELTFHKDILFFVRDRILHISASTAQQASKHKLWRYRWLTAEKVNILDVSLELQLDLYGKIIENFTEETPAHLRYQAILNYHRINTTLAELKAAYFNHMIEIKPKSRWSSYLQHGVDWLTDTVANLDSVKTHPPRHFLDVYGDALTLNWDVYDQLFPHRQVVRVFDDVLQEFLAAVSSDNFIQAKWITLSTSTPKANFDWLKEASFLENYKRSVDRLIHTQNHIDEIISALYSINEKLFTRFIDGDTSQVDYRSINTVIYKLWDLRNKVDELRIYYRTAYLKSFKTTVNQTDKSYWDRFTKSLTNKAVRKVLEGQFFDTSETREQVLQRLRQFTAEYSSMLTEISLINLPRGIAPISPDLLHSIDRGKEFFPVIYTFDEYASIFDGKSALSLEDLRYAQYNIERIAKITASPFWQEQLVEINHLVYANKELTKAVKLAEIYGNFTKNRAFLETKAEIEKAIQSLGPCYLKYIKSEWHRQHPVDANRFVTSASNKIMRLVTTGQIIDTTREFKEIYPDFIKFIDQITGLLVQQAGEIPEPYTEIQIGKVTVKIPKARDASPSVRTARQARKESRSRSLLILEVSASSASEKLSEAGNSES